MSSSTPGGEQQAYDCQEDSPGCPYFGLESICDDPDGGEFPPCENGNKLLCASPPAVPLTNPTSVSTLRVLAYNILELPYPTWQDGQRERTCRIPHEVFRLHPDLDVIVFNELIQGGCFSIFNPAINSSVLNFRDILTQLGFSHFTENVGQPVQPPHLVNGGTFIASRWPIVRDDSHVYTAADNSTLESLAAKGAVYAEIIKTVGESIMNYHILGTHMQSTDTPPSEKVRVKQAEEMRKLMEMQNISPNAPVIYAGDLNVINGTSHGSDVIDMLNATQPPTIGEYMYTYDGPENDLLNHTEYRNYTGWIDYVLYSNNHLQPTSATVEVVRPQLAEPIDICVSANESIPIYATSNRCLRRIQTRDLSDHFGVLGVFEFPSATDAIFDPLSSFLFTLLGVLVNLFFQH